MSRIYSNVSSISVDAPAQNPAGLPSTRKELQKKIMGGRKMRRLWLLFAFLVFPLTEVEAEIGPRVSVQNIEALPKPLPYPYDENADAAARLTKAFANAKASGRRVLVDFGGNWCADCRV